MVPAAVPWRVPQITGAGGPQSSKAASNCGRLYLAAPHAPRGAASTWDSLTLGLGLGLEFCLGFEFLLELSFGLEFLLELSFG